MKKLVAVDDHCHADLIFRVPVLPPGSRFGIIILAKRPTRSSDIEGDPDDTITDIDGWESIVYPECGNMGRL